MLTLDPKARRRLFVFAVILLVFGPIIVAFTSVCIAMKHYYLAYGYASGVLVSYSTFISFNTCSFTCHSRTKFIDLMFNVNKLWCKAQQTPPPAAT